VVSPNLHGYSSDCSQRHDNLSTDQRFTSEGLANTFSFPFLSPDLSWDLNLHPPLVPNGELSRLESLVEPFDDFVNDCWAPEPSSGFVFHDFTNHDTEPAFEFVGDDNSIFCTLVSSGNSPSQHRLISSSDPLNMNSFQEQREFITFSCPIPLTSSLDSGKRNIPILPYPQPSPNSIDLSSLESPSSSQTQSPPSKSTRTSTSSRVEKRKLNTLAARRYRQKRRDETENLEIALKETEKERDDLKVKVARMEGEMEALRALLRVRD
jgi:hypothetical protein